MKLNEKCHYEGTIYDFTLWIEVILLFALNNNKTRQMHDYNALHYAIM